MEEPESVSLSVGEEGWLGEEINLLRGRHNYLEGAVSPQFSLLAFPNEGQLHVFPVERRGVRDSLEPASSGHVVSCFAWDPNPRYPHAELLAVVWGLVVEIHEVTNDCRLSRVKRCDLGMWGDLPQWRDLERVSFRPAALTGHEGDGSSSKILGMWTGKGFGFWDIGELAPKFHFGSVELKRGKGKAIMGTWLDAHRVLIVYAWELFTVSILDDAQTRVSFCADRYVGSFASGAPTGAVRAVAASSGAKLMVAVTDGMSWRPGDMNSLLRRIEADSRVDGGYDVRTPLNSVIAELDKDRHRKAARELGVTPQLPEPESLLTGAVSDSSDIIDVRPPKEKDRNPLEILSHDRSLLEQSVSRQFLEQRMTPRLLHISCDEAACVTFDVPIAPSPFVTPDLVACNDLTVAIGNHTSGTILIFSLSRSTNEFKLSKRLVLPSGFEAKGVAFAPQQANKLLILAGERKAKSVGMDISVTARYVVHLFHFILDGQMSYSGKGPSETCDPSALTLESLADALQAMERRLMDRLDQIAGIVASQSARLDEAEEEIAAARGNTPHGNGTSM